MNASGCASSRHCFSARLSMPGSTSTGTAPALNKREHQQEELRRRPHHHHGARAARDAAPRPGPRRWHRCARRARGRSARCRNAPGRRRRACPGSAWRCGRGIRRPGAAARRRCCRARAVQGPFIRLLSPDCARRGTMRGRAKIRTRIPVRAELPMSTPLPVLRRLLRHLPREHALVRDRPALGGLMPPELTERLDAHAWPCAARAAKQPRCVALDARDRRAQRLHDPSAAPAGLPRRAGVVGIRRRQRAMRQGPPRARAAAADAGGLAGAPGLTR